MIGIYEQVEAKPVLGIQEGSIVMAALVVGRKFDSDKRPNFKVLTWEAGRGQTEQWLTAAEFSDWRRMFIVPSERQ